MRFARLSLERYGRFTDCELDFRAGTPDLHIIYGANELGKSTSLAAVSDLLFGFPGRSPYNFLHDYALLRVGAVLEDDGRSLACRRKKGTTNTLLDADDGVIDDALLTAMLKGQTRDTFGLAFSLDQAALRAGGQAMVDARNDVGRALFAAGSGLTGIADELRTLEAEADAIWAPTVAMRRTFTANHRKLTDATRTVRDSALKPKSWADARNTLTQAEADLVREQEARGALLAALATAQRIRRIAPLVRLREEQSQGLLDHAATIEFGPQKEDETERAVREAEEAVRQRSVAMDLKLEAEARRDGILTEPLVVASAEAINLLVENGGAAAKAAMDLARLEAELENAGDRTTRLRAEAGSNADTTSTRTDASRMRQLAAEHGELAAAIRQVEETLAEAEERKRRARSVFEASADTVVSGSLVDAVDGARALGADVDSRALEGARITQGASLSATAMLSRLAPWSGDIAGLSRLPFVDDEDIEDARARLNELDTEAKRQADASRDAADRASKVDLEIGGLVKGAAVSADDVAAVRQAREERWRPIRDHLSKVTELVSPEEAVAGYEAGVALVDDKTDLRFSSAEASSRLSMLQQSKAALELESVQARRRSETAALRRSDTLAAWIGRLAAASLPALDPDRFRAWQSARASAEDAHETHRSKLSESEALAARRDRHRAALHVALDTLDAGGPIAPILAAAERRRAELEEIGQRRRLAAERLEQTEIEFANLDRRHRKMVGEAAAIVTSWKQALAQSGLVMDMVACATVLDLVEELRSAASTESDMQKRVAGIRRDADEHDRRVNKLADELSIPAGEATRRLAAMRDRLTSAKASAALARSSEEEIRRRELQIEEATGRLRVSEASIEAIMKETGSANRQELSEAIERSRAKRRMVEGLAATDRSIIASGDGMALEPLLQAAKDQDTDGLASEVSRLESRLEAVNSAIDALATTHGHARSAFTALEGSGTAAVEAAADAADATAELESLAEDYILKRAQALTLRWIIEKYRERHQDPLLVRAGELFKTLTGGSFVALRVDADGPSPRLRGMRDGGRTFREIDEMSEGTTDQLFLALRLAALEQSVKAGIIMPLLADDLFVNFDDDRAEAGFKVLAEIARSCQVLFFTHHPHLVEIAKSVVGAEFHSECELV